MLTNLYGLFGSKLDKFLTAVIFSILYNLNSGSSGRVRGGKKHEIYAAAFGSHIFMTYFHRVGGPWPPWPPWIRY